MDLTHDDVKKILEIVDSAQHLDEIELVYGGFRLHLRRGADDGGNRILSSAPASPSVAPRALPTPVGREKATAVPDSAALAEGEVAVRAPMLGTFYRSPSPGDPPFVEVGQRVRATDTVCLIEVMKLFSSIPAGVDGVIARIVPENGALVEYDQALIVIARGQR